MVRINLINPKYLLDQHLNAEHVEILMLLSSARNYNPFSAPNEYKLGKGHINFFKDKLKYLETRFNLIQEEMRRRGFNTNAKFKSNWSIPDSQLNDYIPTPEAIELIKERLKWKINLKPEYYTYKGKYYSLQAQLNLIDRAI